MSKENLSRSETLEPVSPGYGSSSASAYAQSPDDADAVSDAASFKTQLPPPEKPLASSRDECLVLARRARDTFRDACQATEGDAEASFATCKASLRGLWRFQALRDQPFRDLLALIEAPLKGQDFGALNDPQKAAVVAALTDLAKPFIDDRELDRHVDAFLDSDLNVMRPFQLSTGQEVEFTIKTVK